jgi:plastocyanin
LQRVLGITDVNYLISGSSLAIIDSPLDNSAAVATGKGGGTEVADAGSAPEVKIDNFAFTPGAVTVSPGTQVTWINRDDIPHTVDSTQGKFKSAALDTDEKFQFSFADPGEYPYFCRIHPKMTASIIVKA